MHRVIASIREVRDAERAGAMHIISAPTPVLPKGRTKARWMNAYQHPGIFWIQGNRDEFIPCF